MTFWRRGWDRLSPRDGSALWIHWRVCRGTRTKATICWTFETLFSCQRDHGRRQRDIFLAVIGPNAYRLLSSLVAPEKPGENTWTWWLWWRSTIASHPQRSYSGIGFIRDFVPKERLWLCICRSCEHWRIGANLEIHSRYAPRSPSVWGERGDNPTSLLAESGLTLKKALEIAQGLEAAARNVREIQTKPGELTDAAERFQTEEVHEVSRRRSSSC